MESWSIVVLPIAIASIGIALINILRRYIVKDKSVSALQFLVHSNGLATIFYISVYLMFWGMTMPKLLPGFWRAVFFGTGANLFIFYFITKAASIDQGEVSLTTPLQAMTPGLITGLASILGEFPSRIGCAGIFLMICGSYVLLWEKTPKYWYEYFGPIKRILLLLKRSKLSPEERNKTIVVMLSLGSACFGTIGLLFDGLYTRRGINLQGLTMALMTLFGILTIGYAVFYFIRPDKNNSTAGCFGLSAYKTRRKFLSLIGTGLLLVAVILLIQPTYNHTFVAYTGTLKRLSILTSVIMGYLFFREAEFKKRIWAAVLIIAGVILISTDDLPARVSAQIQMWGF